MSLPTQKITKTRTHKRKSAYIRKQQVRLMNLARGLIGRAKGAEKNKKAPVAKKDAAVETKDTKKPTKPVAKAPAKETKKAAPKKASKKSEK